MIIIHFFKKRQRKYRINFIKWNEKAVKKFFSDKDTGKLFDVFRVALSIEEDPGVLMAFNPVSNDIPFYNLAKSNEDRVLNNQDVVERLYEYWGLDKDCETYLIKVRYFAKLNGIELYYLTPHNYDTKMPILRDELEGNENLYKTIKP